MLSAAVSFASELPEPAPNGYKAEPYREIILVLLQRKLSHKKIARFLRNQGVSIHQTAISKYLRAHPPTDEELERAVQLLVRKPQPISPSEKIVSSEGKAMTAPRSSKPASGGRRSRPVDIEDGIDYSFLNVEGRPFRIRPKQ
jgi:hypothetical protein